MLLDYQFTLSLSSHSGAKNCREFGDRHPSLVTSDLRPVWFNKEKVLVNVEMRILKLSLYLCISAL